MRFFLTALFAALVLPACAGMFASTARNASVAELGCPSDEIVVSHVDYAGGAASWQAECRGKTILCTAVGDGNRSTKYTCRAPQ